MRKAKPKVADVSEQNDASSLNVEDAQPEVNRPLKPVKTETKVVNGHELTFEDF